MPKNPPEGTPRISPYLFYQDVGAAVDWLAQAFGFSERFRMPGPDGTVVHAEMEVYDSLIMMGHPGADFVNPKQHGHVHQLQYVYVDDVDKHCEHAKQAGAKILDEPEDQFYGDRRYAAEDLEGHQWHFAQRVRDVAPEDLTAPS